MNHRHSLVIKSWYVPHYCWFSIRTVVFLLFNLFRALIILLHLSRALIICSTEPGILTAGRAGAVGWVLIQALTSLFQVIDKTVSQLQWVRLFCNDGPRSEINRLALASSVCCSRAAKATLCRLVR